jgi:hypothetical protein
MHVPVSGTDAKVDIVDVVIKTSSSMFTTGTLAVPDSRDFFVSLEHKRQAHGQFIQE